MTFTDEDVEAADAQALDVAGAVVQLLSDRDCPPAVAMIALSRALAGVLRVIADGDKRRLRDGADLCNNAIRTYAGNYGDDGAGPIQ